jgi:hypothetical protein
VRTHPLTGALARVTALAGALVLITAALISAQLATAPPAGAVTGLVQGHAFSAAAPQPSKTVRAFCPAGKKVLSGSAAIFASGPHNQLRLVQLVPSHPGSGPDSFVATYMTIGPAFTDNWTVEVDVVCADPSVGMYLVGASGAFGSATTQSVEARCAAGDVVLGGGGLVRNAGFQAALRTMAPSASGDRFTVQGNEDADGYAGTWSVNAYAMCAHKPAGYNIAVVASGGAGDAPTKTTTAICAAGTLPHGVGASVEPAAPAGIGLVEFFVQPPGNTGAQAFAAMTEPTTDWGIFRVFAICAA